MRYASNRLAGNGLRVLVVLCAGGWLSGCESFEVEIVDRREHKAEHYAHEMEYIRLRREAARTRTGDRRDDVAPGEELGVAFSGGGLRSATFNLGVLQALEKGKLLQHVDYLSAVSGGAYIASWYVANVLPRTAILMPMKPARPEPIAPRR